jgi:phage repressor protein C with HTH and peptisase S24 domain
MTKNPKVDPKRVARLKKARALAGYDTAEDFAKKIGAVNSSYRSYENGHRNFTVAWAKKYAPLLGVHWLYLTEGIEKPQETGDFFHIDEYDVSASAGHGTLITEENIIGKAAFRADWIRKMTASPVESLKLIKVSGDSMESTLSDGDSVLIDTKQNSPTKEGIYSVQFDGDVLIKRLQYNPQKKSIRIISDNAKYPPMEITNPASFKIIGRALWTGRRL